MTKFKRLMAIAAVSMLGIQLMGLGTAFAKAPGSGDADCDFGNDSLEVTLGDTDDVAILIDDKGILQCDDNYTGHGNFDGVSDPVPAASIDSITVEMDHEDSLGELWILLDDDANGDASDWPDFATFDLNVTTVVNIDGQDVDDDAGNSLRITVSAKSVSFSGTTATSNATSYEITGGDLKDTIDGTKTAARLTVHGGLEDDVIKGGSGKDKLYGEGDFDTIYGGAGNDLLDCASDADVSAGEREYGWGQDGDDTIVGCGVTAPGAGDDVIEDGDTDGEVMVSYADLTGGIEWTNDDSEVTTGGAAGDDDFDYFTASSDVLRVYGSQGDDLIFDYAASKIYANGGDDVVKVAYDGANHVGATVYGGAGDDFIAALDYDSSQSALATSDTFYGNAGNDVLKGKAGDDELRGGPGSDQAWGGNGSKDLCTAEVLNRCELIKH